MAQDEATPGLGRFTVIWVGQLISLLGSGLTNFIIGVWVYQRTGSVTQFTLIALFGVLPSVILLPWAGVVADRWDRRWLMIGCNAGAAVSTLFMALLLGAGQLKLWHIYLGVAAISTFSTFTSLIYTTTLSLLVSPQHLSRSSGMVYVAQAASQILPPLLGGVLIAMVPTYRLILIDFATYIFAILALSLVRIQTPEAAAERKAKKQPWLRELEYGWSFIKARPGLMALLVYFATLNFIFGITRVLFTPMILNFASPRALGTILSIAGVGFLLGSIVLSVWGGPKNRVQGVLGFGLLSSVGVILVGLRPSVTLTAIATLIMFSLLPVINGCSQAIWLSKTPTEVQGRVFSVRWMLGLSTSPIAYLIAGPLADKVFEPLVVNSDLLSGVLGGEKGRGIGLMFVTAGILTMLAQLAGYRYSRLSRIEQELPDAIPTSQVGV